MLRLVIGLRALDLIYERIHKTGGVIISPFEGSYYIYKNINIESTFSKHIILSLMLKLFKVDKEEYSTIREIIANSKSFLELFKKLENYNFRDTLLNYLVDLVRDIVSIEDGIDKSNVKREILHIRTWISDPCSTFLALSVLLYLYEHDVDRPILLYVPNVDNILDIILMFRRADVYIYSLRRSRCLECFDEVYIYNIPRAINRYGLVKIRDDTIVKCREPSLRVAPSVPSLCLSVTKLDNVSREILSTLSELGFMSLNALRESISHQLNVDKSIVDDCILRLERLGLVELRYLPDGRVIVLPTLMGLVKAKEFC